jgi:hypothetical protein
VLLEKVILAERDEGWRVATTDYYAQYGLHAGGAMLWVDNTVIPNAIATLDTTGLVTVRLGDLRAGWAGECGPALADRIRELGGIGLARQHRLPPRPRAPRGGPRLRRRHPNRPSRRRLGTPPTS